MEAKEYVERVHSLCTEKGMGNCDKCPLYPHCGQGLTAIFDDGKERAMEIIEQTEQALGAGNETARPNEKHYEGAIEPIEVMQSALTAEQFQGFCMGNIIKYSMRCGKKDDPEKELSKVRRYTHWLALSRAGKIIDPRKE